MSRLVACALFSLASCATGRPPDNPYELVGVWGGQHANLSIGTLDAGVEFDCAEGMIAAPYHVGGDGKFAWGGTLTRNTGGPAQTGNESPAIEVTYSGVVQWPDRMTLRVEVEDGQILGPFELQRGADAQIFECL